MTMMDTLPAIRDVREVEMAVEGLLVGQLRRERDRFVEVAEANGVNFETADELLSEFDAWAAARDLPTSAHALVAFMDEAYRAGDADLAKLQDIGHAYLMQHSWDVRLPIIAALEYFGAAPRLIDAGRMH